MGNYVWIGIECNRVSGTGGYAPVVIFQMGQFEDGTRQRRFSLRECSGSAARIGTQPALLHPWAGLAGVSAWIEWRVKEAA